VLTHSLTRIGGTLGSQRGIALPMAMAMLVALTALMVSFAVLASSEPTIAANHQHGSQARNLADSGVQLALWALTNPTHADGIGAMTAGDTASAPYDGATFTSVGDLGGFTVQVTYDATLLPTERVVTSVGWLPGMDVAHANPHRKVQAIAQMGIVRPLDPPCAICAGGDTQVGGNARVDSRGNGCGGATPPPTAIQSGGTTAISGSGDVYGYGNNTRNETGDYANGAAPASFTYTTSELAQLKEEAKRRGTYYQGTVASIPDSGVIFIDTTTGADYTASTPDAQAGNLVLSGTGTFNGVIIVAGSITLSGTKTFNGLVYAQNDITLVGNVTVNGALVSENRKDSSSTTIDPLDASVTGSVTVNYNCDYVRNGGSGSPSVLSTAWTIKPGTYKETDGY
jgi:hypothetical protein